MKKVAAISALVLVTVATASFVEAGSGNVRFTMHNMSNNNSAAQGLTQGQRHYYSSQVDQVCIFCHTPHNASPSVPLWNKAMPTQAFNMYTSSMTLSAVAKGAKAPGPESLLCLSCHDGRTAINVLHNASQYGVAGPGADRTVDIGGSYIDPSNVNNGQALSMATFGWMGTYNANLGKTAADPYFGGNLTNDHPISFSYNAAQVELGATKLNDRPTVNAKSGGKIKFFGRSGDQLECASCHDPHIDYGYGIDGKLSGSPTGDTTLRPFLTMSNANSALCFACHNK